jgi:hypothetical protein
VARIDSAAGLVELEFAPDQRPLPGTLVKVYHTYLLGTQCVGALETVVPPGARAAARPVGNFHLGKISQGDLVEYHSTAR